MNVNDHLKAKNEMVANEYLIDGFNLAVMMKDIRFSRNAMRTGDIIRDLAVMTDKGEKTSLHRFADNKLMLLVAVSITCPMTISCLPFLRELQQTYDKKINIVLIYVREAHPGENYPQPKTLEEKRSYALKFKKAYRVDFPIIIDELNGVQHQSLDTKPNSLHLIAPDGKVLFQSLWASDGSVINAINQALDHVPIRRPVSQRMLIPFLRSTGYMHDTLKLAGKRAYRELMVGAPPVWILSRLASFLCFVPQSLRGGVLMIFLLAVAIVLVAFQVVDR